MVGDSNTSQTAAMRDLTAGTDSTVNSTSIAFAASSCRTNFRLFCEKQPEIQYNSRRRCACGQARSLCP